MKIRLTIAVLLLAMTFLTSCATAPAPGASLRVGASSGVITPPTGTLLAGYDLNRRSTGVHDDLFAKAVVFDDGKTPVALVTLDCIGLMYPDVQALRQEASSRCTALAIPPERIIVSSIHTHCGPDTIGIWGPSEGETGRDETYIKSLIATAAEQVARAAKSRVPAHLVRAEAPTPEWVVNDSEPGDTEKTFPILQCLDASGASIVTLTNLACHPTVLDGDTTDVSADWVGAFYAKMASQLSGEHVFVQGAIGGWIQPVTPERTFALAQRYGEDAASRTLAALKNAAKLQGGPIRFASLPIDMPIENPVYEQMAAAKLTPRLMDKTTKTEVAWFALGDAEFATHPGESAPCFARASRDLMRGESKFIIGLGLDELGYICKTDYFDQPDKYPSGKYLVSMSPGRSAGEILQRALEQLIPQEKSKKHLAYLAY
ncbi:MAG: alkaline ceramidase [Candidatus Hydrogenedentes bacterium]|nr:alkaline ceramidase [Candidatus Hydrogenedentota bacterium]